MTVQCICIDIFRGGGLGDAGTFGAKNYRIRNENAL